MNKQIKTIIPLVILGLLYSMMTNAQGLTAKTNEFALNFKDFGLPTTGPLPKVNWINPQLEFTSNVQNKIELKASVECYSALKEIKLIIGSSKDGSVIGTKTFPTKADQQKYDIHTSITLPDGSNFLSLEVTTVQGVVVSERRQIVIGKIDDNNAIALDRKDYILIFATNKYDNWDDLVNPVDDSQAIAKELKDKYGFVVDMVENPTVEMVWEKLREYNERKFAPQDQLMIFFAGHGHYDESFGEGFVVEKNSLANDVSRTTYLSHNRLRGVINNIGCSHILLAMDVCFGGTLDPVIARSRGAKENELTNNQLLLRKWGHKTRKYLTSGGKEYVSDGIVGKHSPFASKLIESLRSRGGDDGILTLTELQANLEKMNQLPRFGSFGDDEALSDFVFVSRR